ncbi:MAG: penicillin-binding protein 2 [Rickettsiales bacterium]|jgi:cell division protein FtsI (penicillin-binding protein 3)|nr:penicillin-binding protein 2 [Rickettsiales bacterium]
MFEAGADIAAGIGNRAAARPPRLLAALWVLLFLFAYSSLRLAMLGLEDSKTRRGAAGASEWTARADITDRSGELLASSVAGFKIKIYPGKMPPTWESAEILMEIDPSLDSDAINGVMLSSKGGVYLGGCRPLPDYADMLAAARKFRRDWNEIEECRIRRYAKGRAVSHITGFVDAYGDGAAGVEKFLDKKLKGGEPAVLSLDFRAQAIMRRELEQAKAAHGAKLAAGILMDSLNGEIIAAVQLPDFDPESAGSAWDDSKTFWPAQGTYEMGSIFKIFNTALALESGLSRTKKYDVSKPFGTIRDKGASKNRPDAMTIDEIMLHSSNIGSAKIALSLPSGAQAEFFKKIGLHSPLEIDGMGKTRANAARKNPQDIEIATMAYGHGIAVSMMNLIAAVNAVANGGIWVAPRLTKIPDGAEVSGRRVVSIETSKRVREIMFRVSEETTGRLARISGINIGSKTGTAEKRDGKGYSAYRNFNTFVAVFPIESPRYIMLVALDEPDAVPGVSRTAAHNVVPMTGRILEQTVSLLLK